MGWWKTSPDEPLISHSTSWKIGDIEWREMARRLHFLSVLIAIGFGIATACIYGIDPATIPFSDTDPTISYPIRNNTVSDAVDVIVIFVSLLVYGLVAELWFVRKKNKNLTIAMYNIISLLFRFLEAFLVVVFLQQLVAIITGQLRPDFLARCVPEPGTSNCTNPDTAFVNDGRKTYFSGHACTTMCAMSFLSLYLIYAWYWRRNRHERFGPHQDLSRDPNDKWAKFRPWLKQLGEGFVYFFVVAPLIYAVLLGASRVIDNRHSRQDVATGFVIGSAFTMILFPRYVFLNEVGERQLNRVIYKKYVEGNEADDADHDSDDGTGISGRDLRKVKPAASDKDLENAEMGQSTTSPDQAVTALTKGMDDDEMTKSEYQKMDQSSS